MARQNERKMSTTEKVAVGVFVWWLIGGGGIGLGKSGGVGMFDSKAANWARRRVSIRVDGKGFTVDGTATDLAGAIQAARAAGSADVFATGDAIQGNVDAVMRELQSSGVKVYQASKPASR